jgi:hypothetical protein
MPAKSYMKEWCDDNNFDFYVEDPPKFGMAPKPHPFMKERRSEHLIMPKNLIWNPERNELLIKPMMIMV